jgi:hypothetical protein
MNTVTAIPGVFQGATQALQKAVQANDRDAQVIANSGSADSRDVVAALVDSRQQVLYTQAAARIISASDVMTRTLLDIHA